MYFHFLSDFRIRCSSSKGIHSKRISQANIILENLARIFELPFVKLQVPRYSQYWSDNIHLSDLGLRVFMHSMENSIHRFLNTFLYIKKDFPPLTGAVHSEYVKGIVSNFLRFS